MTSMETVKEVLAKEGYVSSDEFARDGVLVLALSRLGQYRAEVESFEKKHGMALKEFESSLHADKGGEDFEKEADLEDWEFALNALKWWEGKLKELQHGCEGGKEVLEPGSKQHSYPGFAAGAFMKETDPRSRIQDPGCRNYGHASRTRFTIGKKGLEVPIKIGGGF